MSVFAAESVRTGVGISSGGIASGDFVQRGEGASFRDGARTALDQFIADSIRILIRCVGATLQ